MVQPFTHDAAMLDARVAKDGRGVDLAPAFDAGTFPWPEQQDVQTPWGTLRIIAAAADDSVLLTLTALVEFRVQILAAGRAIETRSRGEVRIPL
ncbi:MAG: hypothetical protein A2498_08305 [Lentisphaerae bacterium RIFOXYC12_FULL_60_16]|nr:MAG: hypothetical protein A2498_08305 [Lentisphaerae bacterium RIFOXYC12_FULL_60_16]